MARLHGAAAENVEAPVEGDEDNLPWLRTPDILVEHLLGLGVIDRVSFVI